MKIRTNSIKLRESFFPEIFKMFVLHFDFGPDLIKTEKYYFDKYDRYYELSYLYYHSELDFQIGRFLSIDEIYDYYDMQKGYSSLDIENGYIRIATINRGGSIFVDKNDEIVLNVWDFEDQYVLAGNIFEFMNNVTVKIILEADLIENVKFENLYKNWGEEYWRIK